MRSTHIADSTKYPSSYEVVYTTSQIEHATRSVAEELKEWIKNSDIEIVFITVLNGAKIFSSDLERCLPTSEKFIFDCVKAKSRDTTSGEELDEVFIYDPIPDVKNKRVVVVDEICDSGKTLKALTSLFYSHGATEVISAVLVDRVSEDRDYNPNISGISHKGNEWFVGYGMDPYRNLPMLIAMVLDHERINATSEISLKDIIAQALLFEVRPIPQKLLFEIEPTETLEKNSLQIAISDRYQKYHDGEDALIELARFYESLLSREDITARVSPQKMLSRLSFLQELAHSFLFPKDEEVIFYKGSQVPFNLVEFRGSFLRGKLDASDIDIYLRYDNESLDRLPSNEIDESIRRHIKIKLSNSQAFHDGASSIIASGKIKPEDFPIDLYHGNSILYKKPNISEYSESTALIFTPTPDGYLGARFFSGSNTFQLRDGI